MINAVAWNITGESIAFKVTTNKQASSARPLDELSLVYPDIVVCDELHLSTSALRDVVPHEDLVRIDLVNLDIQGAELRALQGFEEFLGSVRTIYSEVNLRSLYLGCASFSEMKAFLANRGFRLVDWELLRDGWGDALWIHEDYCPRFVLFRRSLRRVRYRARQARGVLVRLRRLT